MAERTITIYSSPGWGGCHAAKAFLSSKGIPFTDLNVAEDPSVGEEMVRRSGQRGTPVIIVDDEVIVGFNRGKLERILGI